jgi:hypothetical protein
MDRCQHLSLQKGPATAESYDMHVGCVLWCMCRVVLAARATGPWSLSTMRAGG